MFIGIEKLLWLFTCDGNLEMINYVLSIKATEDLVMADGTTAFSMALAKGRCDLIKEFLQHKRSKDMKLAQCAALEPNINADVKLALYKSICSNCFTAFYRSILQPHSEPILDLSEFQVQLHPCRE